MTIEAKQVEEYLEALSDLKKLSPKEKEEYERLEKELESCEKRLAALQGKSVESKPKNYRYVIDFSIPYRDLGYRRPNSSTIIIDGSQYAPIALSSSATIKKNTIFYCSSLEYSLYAIGESVMVPDKQRVQRIFPTNVRDYCNFRYAIRDTGSDRAWQNTFIPFPVLHSGNDSGLELAVPTVISGGAEVFVDIEILEMWYNNSNATIRPVSSFLLQFNLCGYEVAG